MTILVFGQPNGHLLSSTSEGLTVSYVNRSGLVQGLSSSYPQYALWHNIMTEPNRLQLYKEFNREGVKMSRRSSSG